MGDSIDTLFSDVNTQKQFLKNSILNSAIIYKHFIKDYFQHFLSNLSPLSRYEFWCFVFSLFGSTAILSSLLYFVYTLVPAAKIYADIIFYLYIVFALNVSMRAFACRIISVQQYLINIKSDIKHHKAAFIESMIKKFFINTKTYYAAACINILIIAVYFLYRLLNTYGAFSITINNSLILSSITFFVFTVQMSAVMYVILSILPSNSSLEYFMDKNIKYYHVFHYYNVFSKNYMVDYLTLVTGILLVISVGHLLIIGFTLSCHLIMCTALLVQSAALIFSGRYFSVVIGLANFIYCIVYFIFMFSDGIVDTFYNADTIMQILDHYQVSLAVLFIGLFYHITFDKDMLKMAAVLGCFLSAILLWDDHTAVKDIVVYDNHTIPVLFYGLIGLLTFFVYLVRVANYKGYYISETQIWNDYSHYVNQVTLKNIYTILFYSCLALALYSCVLMLYPLFQYIIHINIFDSYALNFLHNIRKMLTLYIFLGLFLLFRCYQDIFSIFLISFIVICDLYIVIYSALCSVFPEFMIYKIEYLYTAINAVAFILSISLIKYSRIMAYGFAFSIMLFAVSLLGVFTDYSYQNSLVVFYIFFISLFMAVFLAAVGARKKIKQYT